MRKEAVIDRLREFIVTSTSWSGPREKLTADLPLLENGVLDSLGIFEVVAFLEEECDVTIGDEDLVPANFATLSAIADLATAANPDATDSDGVKQR